MKTKNNIYLNLNESEYKVIKGGLIFYFSSELYMKKFEREAGEYIINQNIVIENRYKVNISCDLYLLICLYKKIEKRGFRIFDDVNKKEITPYVTFITQILSY